MSFRPARSTLSLCLALSLAFGPVLPVQAQPVGIPSMGAASGAELSPALERTLGNAIMEQGRRSPEYVSDPDINQYLTDMGRKLAQYGPAMAQPVTVFALRDSSINAFALPGGYIGIHSGLFTASKSESELASVLAHEIAHVAQRHVARGITQSAQSNHLLIAALAGALLGALAGSGDLAMGAAAFGQAAAVDRQLGFSRQAEQEADRLGFEMLLKAGYEPQGMVQMFQRLAAASRLNERATANEYASTHPMSQQRESDISNRVRGLPAKQYQDTPSFWYIRAKLMVLQAGGGQSLRALEQALQSTNQSQSEVERSAAQYGLAYIAQGRQDYERARAHLAQARAQGKYQAPELDTLDIRIAIADRDIQGALNLAKQAWQRWPKSQGVALAYVQVLQQLGQNDQAQAFLLERIKQWPDEPQLHQLLAQTYDRLGDGVKARRAMAEYYQLVGALPTAVEQLQQARNLTQDFYQQSELDTQIRQLRERVESERVLLERFRS
ncbi:M48 family metalloprotease [Alcaligenes ammonioxydans]|uniref:M48 family metalloprotease n=1 Tax=Alcaligenes ammonioxydans TaxID=2582914 RepID=A0ABX8SV20_9BURK|nr:M48 family metalloprotease [Alcaligenes ammonioxydans]QXX79890.1 M48 family metalloprotease [Alcaligenes ammonioxydans]